MEKPSIFEESDFRAYIEKRLKCEDFGRGAKAKLAEHLGCQPSFISQVLKGKNTLSLEQGFKINSLFKHSNLEQDFFIHLLEYDKAGSFDLQNYFQKKLEDLKEKAKLIENHIDFDHLSEEDTIAYYNNWHHVYFTNLINIPEYQHIDTIKDKLNISDEDFESCVNFLTSRKLVILEEDGNLRLGSAKLHIRKGSPLADFANKTARLHNIQNLKSASPNSLNYGAYITMSEKNFSEFKQRFVNLLSELHGGLENDSAEVFCSLIIDFMEL